jgi:hypothetical protein
VQRHRALGVAIARVSLSIWGVVLLQAAIYQASSASSLWSGLGALAIALPGVGTLVALVAALVIKE